VGEACGDRCPPQASALVDALTDDQLALRVDAAAWLAAAELSVDRFAEADVHASRGLTLGRADGQGEILLVLQQVLGSVWCVRGKLTQATELLDGTIEAARLLGKTEELTWSLFNRSAIALAVGDVDTALASAQESVELTRVPAKVSLPPGLPCDWPEAFWKPGNRRRRSTCSLAPPVVKS
jgi:ATP/maltotriose-dependent transcriptional regulator MalT